MPIQAMARMRYERSRLIPPGLRRWGAAALAVVAAVAVACHAGPLPVELGPALRGWRDALQPNGPLRVMALPERAEDLTLPPGSVVVVVHDGWREPEPCSAGQRAALRAFVERGGRLLLFGHAAGLVAELGIEVEQPEHTTFRWGYDQRTADGRAGLGLQVVSGKLPTLFEPLTATAGDPHTYLLAGGQPCTAPLCSWAIGAPQQGVVLARFAAERDGQLAATEAAVVGQWACGEGRVLACGVLPDLAAEDATVRANARAFVGRCAALLQGGQAMALVDLPVPPVDEPQDLPGVPLLAHWGWQAPLATADGTVRTPDEVLTTALLPSWLAGADLCELDLLQPGRGAPLGWSAQDPIKPPAGWQVDPRLGPWNAGALAQLAAEAHARGMLAQASLDPLPVADRAADRLVALRFLARELADRRRLGDGAFDGFGLRAWWPDTQGYGVAMVQDFQPGAFLYRAGERVADLAGGLRALDAQDGAPRGLPFAGLSSTWRDGFPADAFPLGVLEARGDGATGDWIVTQANDFVRARRGRGGAMWWRSHDPAQWSADAQAYVEGVSLEPLRAAVAMRLAATGSDGLRAAAAALLRPAPPGFGGEVAAPAAVHALQNNWFRLLGSGGALQFDRSGLARFDASAVVLSPAFLRTRLFGGRPRGDEAHGEVLDLLFGGVRGEGGYGGTAHTGTGEGADRRLPAVLAGDELPAWPRRVAVEVSVGPGYYELEVALRGVRGQGVLQVALDGGPLRCLPFVTGEPAAPVSVPVHLAGGTVRTLQFTVVDGGAVAFDRLVLARRGDVAAEAEVLVPAGSLARLGERSRSSYHQESVQLTAIADVPGFVAAIRCERAVRNLQIERTFALPGYDQLVAAGPGEGRDGLRAPFVVRAGDVRLPDLVVVPLQLGRYERFQMRAGELVLHSAPEAGSELRLGFLMAPRRDGPQLRECAAPVLAAMPAPQRFDVGDHGVATLHSDLPFAWTRVVALDGNVATPCLVREGGWWTWRGTQPASDGGRWLRVVQMPRDPVEVVVGPSVLARTRPGPGSLRLVALRDPEPRSVTVRVLQPSRLAPPAVTMAADFDEVQVDGQPWAFFAGRTIYLPDRVGEYRIATFAHGGGPVPHVAATRAPLRRCAWDAAARELVLDVGGEPGRPVELAYTAVVVGPQPKSIENGELVAESQLPHADPQRAAAAAAGGYLVRLHPGIVRIRHGE